MLRVDSIDVGASRVSARVTVSDDALRTSLFPGFAERALTLLPGMIAHRCDCGSAHGIAAELADTELAHALEHVALEIAVGAGSPRSLSGRTSWDFARTGRGVFTVELDYDDDLVVLGALGDAVDVVAWLSRPVGGSPDVAAMTSRLRAMRTVGEPGARSV